MTSGIVLKIVGLLMLRSYERFSQRRRPRVEIEGEKGLSKNTFSLMASELGVSALPLLLSSPSRFRFDFAPSLQMLRLKLENYHRHSDRGRQTDRFCPFF